MRLEIGGAPPAKGCWRRSDCRKAHRARTTCTSRTRAELAFWSSWKHRAVSIVSGHNQSLLRIINQISALFITDRRKARPKIVFIGRHFTNREPTGVITLPASGALLMMEDFASDLARAQWKTANRVICGRAPLPDAALRRGCVHPRCPDLRCRTPFHDPRKFSPPAGRR